MTPKMPPDHEAPSLLPCPFCGERSIVSSGATFRRSVRGMHCVVCPTCSIGTRAYGSADQALASWNRRAASAPDAAARAITAEQIVEECAKVCEEADIVGCRNPYNGDDARATLRAAAAEIRALTARLAAQTSEPEQRCIHDIPLSGKCGRCAQACICGHVPMEHHADGCHGSEGEDRCSCDRDAARAAAWWSVTEVKPRKPSPSDARIEACRDALRSLCWRESVTSQDVTIAWRPSKEGVDAILREHFGAAAGRGM